MTEIKNFAGDVIYTSKKPDDTVKAALEQAVKAALEQVVKAGVTLREANLKGEDLMLADLRDAALWLAWQYGLAANLRRANLHGADLRGAKILMGDRTFKLEECDD